MIFLKCGITSIDFDLQEKSYAPYTLNPLDSWNNCFSVKIGRSLYGLSEEDIIKRRQIINDDTQLILQRSQDKKTKLIPLSQHRVWITDNDHPIEPQESLLTSFLESISYPTAEVWEYHFWCKDKSKLPHTIRILQKSPILIQIHEVSEIISPMKGRKIFEQYDKDHHFSLASEVLRHNIIYLFGRVYCDLNVLLRADLTSLVYGFNHIWGIDRKSPNQAFFAYQKNDPIIAKYLNALDQLSCLPLKVKELTPTFETRRIWSSEAHIMASIDQFSTDQDHFLFLTLNEGGFIKIHPLNSARRAEIHGNKLLSQGTINIFNLSTSDVQEEFQRQLSLTTQKITESIERKDKTPLFAGLVFGEANVVKLSIPQELEGFPYQRLLSDPFDQSLGNFEYYKTFLLSLYEKFFSVSLKEIRAKRSRLLSQTRSTLLKITHESSKLLYCLPLITHRIWLTDSINSFEVPEDRMDLYFESLNILSGADWQHHFWCLDPEKIPLTVHKIKQSHRQITIHSIDEILPRIRGRKVFLNFLKGKYFTAASDILRFNLLHHFGGIYSDFGVQYNTDLTPYLNRFDYIFGQEGYIAGTSFLAARQNSFVVHKLLEFIDNLEGLPPDYRTLGEGIITPPWTSLGILTVIFDIHTQESDRILPCPYGQDSLIKTNHMASWLGEGKFGQVSLHKKPIPLEMIFSRGTYTDYAYRFNPQADRLLKDYTLEVGRLLYNVDQAYFEQKREDLFRKSCEVYYHPNSLTVILLPFLTHRTWLTDSLNPSEVPTEYLKIYIDSLLALSSHDEWCHNFWCIDSSKIPQTIAFLEEAKDSYNLNLKVHEVREVLPQMRGRKIFEAFIKDHRFCNANDIFRLNILYLQGGLYADMGFKFLKDFSPFLSLYDQIFFLYPWGNIDHNLCGVRKGDHILDRYLRSLEEIHLLPSSVQNVTPSSGLQLAWTGSHHFMILLDLLSQKSTRILFMSEGTFLSHIHADSWGKSPRFGNRSIQESNVNIFKIDV